MVFYILVQFFIKLKIPDMGVNFPQNPPPPKEEENQKEDSEQKPEQTPEDESWDNHPPVESYLQVLKRRYPDMWLD